MLEQKSFPFEIKEADDTGKIVGYASTFDNLDDQGDVVRNGAFLETIAHKQSQVPLLWQHRTNEPIGKTTVLSENDRGLFMEARLVMKLQKAQEALALVKEGIVKGLSIGYEAADFGPLPENQRELRGIKLYEISLVTFPANEQAQIIGAKNLMDKRCAEGILREAGYSRNQAKALLAKGFDGLKNGDACEAVPDEETVELTKRILQSTMHQIQLERLMLWNRTA